MDAMTTEPHADDPTLDDPTARFRLDGRVVVVTGASSGLGARFAAVAASAGADVLAVARREERLRRLAEVHPAVRPVVADITTDAGVAALEQAVDAIGRVDVLLNNAGIQGAADPLTEDIEHFRHVLDVNLTGLYRVTQVAIRRMVAQGGGSVVNISSIVGQVASAPIDQPGYCAAKGGVIALTRDLAVGLARRGVRVNCIAPGFFPSEMTDHMWQDEGTVRFVHRNCPMRREGRPDELDGAFLFLASEMSSYVTGQVITVDGGWVAR